MFFILSKILAFLTMPMSWAVILLVLAYFVPPRARRACLLSGVVMTLLLTSPLLTDYVYQKWCEKVWQPLEKEAQFDYAIVAGGFSDYNMMTDQWDVNRSGDRMIETIRLYKRGVVKKVLVSGDAASNGYFGRSSKQHFIQAMGELGLKEEDLLIEEMALNTRENAVLTREMLPDSIDGSHCLLVTSAFHGYRTGKCYDKVGLQCRLYVTDIPADDRTFDWKRLFPEWRTLEKWNELCHEWLGIVTYWAVGYI